MYLSSIGPNHCSRTIILVSSEEPVTNVQRGFNIKRVGESHRNKITRFLSNLQEFRKKIQKKSNATWRVWLKARFYYESIIDRWQPIRVWGWVICLKPLISNNNCFSNMLTCCHVPSYVICLWSFRRNLFLHKLSRNWSAYLSDYHRSICDVVQQWL